jgi:hypothetical protein
MLIHVRALALMPLGLQVRRENHVLRVHVLRSCHLSKRLVSLVWAAGAVCWVSLTSIFEATAIFRSATAPTHTHALARHLHSTHEFLVQVNTVRWHRGGDRIHT